MTRYLSGVPDLGAKIAGKIAASVAAGHLAWRAGAAVVPEVDERCRVCGALYERSTPDMVVCGCCELELAVVP